MALDRMIYISAVARLTWGFPLDGKPNAVFNTRIESALEQLRLGRRGMWAKAIAEGRCLVPVRAFYEGHMTERVESERTGKPVRRQYRFRIPGARAFLLAAVQADGRFSVVTTAPNASVSPVHDRMPLVLGPGESGVWLGPDSRGSRTGARSDSPRSPRRSPYLVQTGSAFALRSLHESEETTSSS